MSDYIDDRLHSWAKWVAGQLDALGYPSMDILYNQARYGTPIDKQGQAPDLEHEDEMQMDTAMRKLRDVHPVSHDVLVAKYLRILPDGKSAKGLLDKQLAGKLRMNDRKMYHHMERGKDWLAGYLEAIGQYA